MSKVAGTGYPRRRVSPKLANPIESRRDSTTWKMGFTLVEMLAVIAVSSVILVIATSAVHRAMRLEHRWADQADTNRVLARLARDLRADVHRCHSASLSDDSLVLTAHGGEVITYEITETEIIRDVQAPSKERRREFYRLPDGCKAEMTVTASEPAWIELRVTSGQQLVGVAPRVVLNVKSEAGRLTRLAQSTGGEP